jgi:uncharacterized protein (TIGR04255 family)
MDQSSQPLTNPPVVEVVLGVQFAPLTDFNSGHLGWFWKLFLGREWGRAADAPPLPDQFETFEATRWGPPVFAVKLDSPARPRRLQITSEAGDRLIQVQPTQFIYNWMKKERPYAGFDQVYAEFMDCFNRFRQFVTEANLGEVSPNQWEVTYVDQIPRGELWQTAADWHRVLPGLFGAQPAVDGLRLEGCAGEWHYEVVPGRGRLHVSAQQGTVDEQEPVLMMQTTARGPIGKGAGLDLEGGLRLGHAMAGRAFFTMTSPEAQAYWRR